MWKLPEARAEAAFVDYKSAYTSAQAIAEAQRCLYCFDAPCVRACPTSINIPEFIRKIATDNVKGSARTIFTSNILGMSCARVCPVEVLCVGDCVYNALDIPPIQIGRLQRYSTDRALEDGWRFFSAGADTGKSVGLVGAGPASIAAAHELRRFGHAVTIYEKAQIPGGLNVTGVAPYKLRADDALAELNWVMGIGGIEVKTGVEIGKDLSWDDVGKAHDAVFLGLGLGPDRKLPGSEKGGIFGAVDYIERFKLGTVDLSSVRSAAVLGGGNTAVDCVRELIGLGVPNVTLVYRGAEAKMSGYKHEWKAAKVQGARAIWGATPTGFVGEKEVAGVRVTTADGERIVTADLVLIAIGQGKLGESLVASGVAVRDGTVVVDPHGATTRAGWFAGGDLSNGGKEVVNAVAEGQRAARSIHQHLTGGAHA